MKTIKMIIGILVSTLVFTVVAQTLEDLLPGEKLPQIKKADLYKLIEKMEKSGTVPKDQLLQMKHDVDAISESDLEKKQKAAVDQMNSNPDFQKKVIDISQGIKDLPKDE